MFQPGGLNGSVESGFGQRACPIWPQLKHLMLEKSHPCRKGGRYPCPEANGVRGDPGGWFARRAIGRISYPILLARANIWDNDDGIAGSETPCPVHCELSIMVNISSDSSSSSIAKACSASLWMFTDALRLAKSVQTSISVCSFRSFWVRITTHKNFLSSGSYCPCTNCSLINSWRISGELCG